MWIGRMGESGERTERKKEEVGGGDREWNFEEISVWGY